MGAANSPPNCELLLVDVGQRLRTGLREGNTVARMGATSSW